MKRILKMHPNLSSVEAANLLLKNKKAVFDRKLEKMKNKKKNNNKGNKKSQGCGDAMYKTYSGGFETNRNKH